MSRTQIAFASADISALARSLKEQLTELGETPSHVQMLNMLAKSAGYRNFQHLKAEAEAPPVATVKAVRAAPPPEPVNDARVTRASNYFGPGERMTSWPSKTSHQELCIWALWARYPAREVMDERGISAWLNMPMIESSLSLRPMSGTADGRPYLAINPAPPTLQASTIADTQII